MECQGIFSSVFPQNPADCGKIRSFVGISPWKIHSAEPLLGLYDQVHQSVLGTPRNLSISRGPAFNPTGQAEPARFKVLPPAKRLDAPLGAEPLLGLYDQVHQPVLGTPRNLSISRGPRIGLNRAGRARPVQGFAPGKTLGRATWRETLTGALRSGSPAGSSPEWS